MLVTQSLSTIERFLFNYMDINEQIFTQNKAKHKVRSNLPLHHQYFFPHQSPYLNASLLKIHTLNSPKLYIYTSWAQIIPFRWLCNCDVLDVAYYT